MKRVGPASELRTLTDFLDEIETRFLEPHLGVANLGSPSRAECLDVAAYVVLAHGAFENFVEGLGLWALEKTQNSWTFKKRATRATVSLLFHHPKAAKDDNSSKDEGDDGKPLSVFDTIREAVDAAKSTVSTKIKDNNGIASPHLRAIFLPLGIDVPNDVLLTASLDQLVKLRHQWAHRYRFGTTVNKSADDVKKIVSDCLAIAQQLAEDARAACPA